MFFFLSLVMQFIYHIPTSYTLAYCPTHELGITGHQSSSNCWIVKTWPSHWALSHFVDLSVCFSLHFPICFLAMHASLLISAIVRLSDEKFWVNWNLLMITKIKLIPLIHHTPDERVCLWLYLCYIVAGKYIENGWISKIRKIGTSLVVSVIKMIPWSSSKEQNETWNANVHGKKSIFSIHCLAKNFSSVFRVETVNNTFYSRIVHVQLTMYCLRWLYHSSIHLCVHLTCINTKKRDCNEIATTTVVSWARNLFVILSEFRIAVVINEFQSIPWWILIKTMHFLFRFFLFIACRRNLVFYSSQ